MNRIQRLELYAKRLGFVAEDWNEAATMCYEYGGRPKPRIAKPEDFVPYFKGIGYEKQEHFVAAYLDGGHNLIKSVIITIGLVNRTVVHPREVFRPGIECNAVALIVAHNHPSGMLEPSPEDIEITTRLKNAGEVIGIELLDHLILGKNAFLSFKIRGLVFS